MSSVVDAKSSLRQRAIDEFNEFAIIAAYLVICFAAIAYLVGLMHYRPVADSIAEIGGGTLDQLIATSVVVLLILIPFFAFRALGAVVGEHNLARVFFEPRRTVDKA